LKSLKLEQAENKLKQAQFKNKSDSIDLVAVKRNSIANTQFNRTVQLNSEGLKAPTDVEEKRLAARSRSENYYKKINY
jgi:hypothetical protein